MEFRCRVGHAFPPRVLLDEHTSTQERKLYEAILALEEGATLAEYMGQNFEEEHRARFIREAEQLRRHAAGIRKMIDERIVPPID